MLHIKAAYIFFILHAIQTIAAAHKKSSTTTLSIFSPQDSSSQSSTQLPPSNIVMSAVADYDTTYAPGTPTMLITRLHIMLSPRKPLIEKLMRKLFDAALQLAEKEKSPVIVVWDVDPVLGRGAPLPAEEEAWHVAAMEAWRSENRDRAIIMPAKRTIRPKDFMSAIFYGTEYKALITPKTTNEADAKRPRTDE